MFEAANFGHKHFAPSMEILEMMHAYRREGLHEAPCAEAICFFRRLFGDQNQYPSASTTTPKHQ